MLPVVGLSLDRICSPAIGKVSCDRIEHCLDDISVIGNVAGENFVPCVDKLLAFKEVARDRITYRLECSLKDGKVFCDWIAS